MQGNMQGNIKTKGNVTMWFANTKYFYLAKSYTRLRCMHWQVYQVQKVSWDDVYMKGSLRNPADINQQKIQTR